MNIDVKTVLLLLTKLLWLHCFVLSYGEFINDQLSEVDSNKHLYTNKWVVHMEDGPDAVRKLAEKHNFIFHGQLGSLAHLYHLEHTDVNRYSHKSADEHHKLLAEHPRVFWLEQQKILKRRRRGYISDPLWEKQWYLKNNGQTKARCGGAVLDINVLPVWQSNITGQGVVVSILDDGLEYTHPDLQKNYDKLASHDYNGYDSDPFPRYTENNVNKHGTRCAGEVAAEINNGICGGGVAFNAKVGGIRMLDGDVTDAVEAGSLSHNHKHIDIYSSSWGPDDDGKTVDGPGPLAKKAFRDGVKEGRKGRGSIFVWATGNGGHVQDYCSCDGYINSPYTISIGAVDNCGKQPWYAEACPSTLAVTYSSGEVSGTLDRQIATTDLHKQCTVKHTGTSAAAPLAAGIFALVLEANHRLTWRDLQHLVVQTSKLVSPKDYDWQINGVGHKVSSKFGFGTLDTAALVNMASSKSWKTVQPQHVCATDVSKINLKLKQRGVVETEITDSGCANLNNCVTKLEHVHVIINLEKKRQRGQLEMTLISPSGTKSPILRRRHRDSGREGFKNWAFLTVLHWDENPNGKWRLSITDHSNFDGTLIDWHLKFYGTCDMKSMFNIKINESEICDKECKRECPKEFSKVCLGCSRYCDCTIGQCVEDCNDHLVTDYQLRHCKRSLDKDYTYRPNSNHEKIARIKPVMGISLSAKFAIICLSLLVISAMVAGIAYFAAKMPNGKELPKGYHSVSKYPCSDVIVEGCDEEQSIEEVENTVNS